MNSPLVHPSILTYTGQYFDYNKSNNAILIGDISQALANTCRFGGHTREFYSVAQHSVIVSRIVPRELALWGLLHDAAEAYVGDIPRPLKDLLPNFKDIELHVERQILPLFGLIGEIPPEVKHADLVLLATERRDLMPEQAARWALLDGIEPLDETIDETWTPRRARDEFIIRFQDVVIEMNGRAA